MISEENGKILLQIARKNIESWLFNDIAYDFENLEENSWLKENGAAFVTLTMNDDLRGCIGSLQAYRSLCDDVIQHSFNAAFKDPRFLPLTKEEFKNIRIEISVLSTRTKVEYSSFEDLKTKIIPYKDGIFMQSGFYSSTFLPQVWKQLPIFEDFFGNLCLKAGLEANYLQNGNLPLIERYSVIKFEEDLV